MATSNFLDANVWMALIWDRHMHSEAARQWFNQADDKEFLFCRLTQLTVLRLFTTQSVMGHDTQSMAGAWKLWDAATADSRVGFVGEPAGLESELRSRSR